LYGIGRLGSLEYHLALGNAVTDNIWQSLIAATWPTRSYLPRCVMNRDGAHSLTSRRGVIDDARGHSAVNTSKPSVTSQEHIKVRWCLRTPCTLVFK